jgi:hypothetical protein
MVAQYAKSFIDRLYDAKDVCMLRDVIGVVQSQRQLPEQFSVFTGLWDWVCSARSGIYQYYECMEHRDISEFESLAAGLAKFGFSEISDRYRSGMAISPLFCSMCKCPAWTALRQQP